MKKTVTLNDKTFEVMIPAHEIDRAVAAVAERLNADYGDKERPIFVGVLNGAFMFLSDLIKKIDFTCEISFVKLASYEGTCSTGNVECLLGLNNDIAGRHVIIVEDIVDTGRSIAHMYADLMRRNPASVEVCTLAHNHALDFKEGGLNDTAANVMNAGMGAAGYKNAWYEEKDGVRVCFLAFTEWDYSADEIAARVREEKAGSDIVIVSMHWGEELRAKPTSTQERYAHAIIDAGADLVLGHHPHVLGGIEQYKGKYIVYSLGNFCFGGNSNPDDKDTMIFQQTFNVSNSGVVTDGGINIIPCSISSISANNNYQPTPLSGEEGNAVIRKVAALSSAPSITWMDSYTGPR